jgi:hypothetical protein
MSGSTREVTDFEIPRFLVGFLSEPAMAMGDGSLECGVEPKSPRLAFTLLTFENHGLINVRTKNWNHCG